MRWKALIIEPIHPVLLATLDELEYEYTLVKNISKQATIQIIDQYHGIITSNKLYIDKEIIDAGIQLKWIGRMGSGMEIIDVDYATTKGIVCMSSPEGNANAVAEQALGMYLSLRHNIVKSHLQLLNNVWQRDENRGDEISYDRVGIIGYGSNGSLFAQKLAALGVAVLAYDKYKHDFGTANVQCCQTLDELLENVNVVSFHVPLNAETFHYFNQDFLQRMQHPFILLNLSRGGVVDLNAVVKGLHDTKILGAAIDVWPYEPITKGTGIDKTNFTTLMHHSKVIGTAHIGGYSQQATYKMSAIVANKIKQLHLDGNV